jgi:hypothetical protein
VFAYFRVMCWGHGEESFQFRHLKNGEVSELETVVFRTREVRNERSPDTYQRDRLADCPIGLFTHGSVDGIRAPKSSAC